MSPEGTDKGRGRNLRGRRKISPYINSVHGMGLIQTARRGGKKGSP